MAQVNVFTQLLKNDVARYIGNVLVDKNGNAIPVGSGANAYLYKAYASDASGTGFSLSADAGLHFVALKQTISPIASPVVGDFSGLWVKYIGDDGEPGIDGDDGPPGAPGDTGAQGDRSGYKLSFDNATAGGDPGTNKFTFNHATLASATQLNISKTGQNSMNIGLSISAWEVNGVVSIFNNSNLSATFAQLKIASITDNSTYYSIVFANPKGVIFTDSDTCVIQYSPPGTAGATGAQGSPGSNGNTLLTGTVDPTTEGVDGDSYLNTATNTLFGPKAAGVWPAGKSVQGDKAGIRLKFSTDTTTSDTSQGYWKLNNATIASANEMRIDDLNAFGTNIESLIQSWVPGDRLYFVNNTNGTTNFVDLTVTIKPVDATGRWVIGVAYNAGTLPANNDNMVLQHCPMGTKAGDLYNFDTTVSAGDPGNGGIRFNSATLNLVTAIHIDDLDALGNDLSAAMTAWEVNSELTIKSVRNNSTKFAKFSITSITDNGTHFTIVVVYIAGSTLFSLGEQCSLQHYAGYTDGVRVIRSGGVPIGIKDKNGVNLAGVQTAANFAALPAAAGHNKEVWYVENLELYYQCNGTYWVPQNKTCMYYKSGALKRVTAPASSFTPTGVTNLGGGVVRIASSGDHGLTAAVHAAATNTHIYLSAFPGSVPGLYKISALETPDGTGNYIDIVAVWNGAMGAAPTVAKAGTDEIVVHSKSVHPLTPTSSLDFDVSTENISAATTKRIILTFGASEIYNLNQNTLGNIINRVTGGINNMGDPAIQRTSHTTASASGSGTTVTASGRFAEVTSSPKTFSLVYVIGTAGDWMECTQFKLRMSVA